MGGYHYWPNPPADPAVVCKCGHDLAAHTGSGVAGIPCNVCGVNRKGWPTGNCTGWDPPTRGEERDAHDLHDSQQRGSRAGADVTGPAGATTPTGPPAGPHPFVGRQDRWCEHEQCHRPDRDPIHAPAGPPDFIDEVIAERTKTNPAFPTMVEQAMAGPPDLTHAIQAATKALRKEPRWWVGQSDDASNHVARVAVEAAFPQAIHAATDALRTAAWPQMERDLRAAHTQIDQLERIREDLFTELRSAREANQRLQDDAHTQIDQLRIALERTRHNFMRAVQGLPVRDMTETLAEVESALDLAAPEQHP
jgi:hypothetical protein